MVGRCIPYWNSPFLGDMIVFWGVSWKFQLSISFISGSCWVQNEWLLGIRSLTNKKLGGGNSKIFICSPRTLGKWFNLTSIFFKWVGSTTNQKTWPETWMCFFVGDFYKFRIPWDENRHFFNIIWENIFFLELFPIRIVASRKSQENCGKANQQYLEEDSKWLVSGF